MCASNYSSCLGYNPFAGNGTFITPTACSTGSVPTLPASPEVDEWTVTELIRYCAVDEFGCEYNFGVATGDEEFRCSASRLDVDGALTESFDDLPCVGTDYTFSWNYDDESETGIPVAILTVTNQVTDEEASFIVNDPNGREVTPSNPRGSGDFGDLGPEPVQDA